VSCFVCTFNIKGFAAGILVKFYCTFLLYLPRESLSNPTVPFFYTYHRNPCLIVPYLSSIMPRESLSNCAVSFFFICRLDQCQIVLYLSAYMYRELFLILPYLCFAVTCMFLQCCGSRSGGSRSGGSRSGGSVNNCPPGSGSVNSELQIRIWTPDPYFFQRFEEIKEKKFNIL
jgi:hypothetical protein